MLRDRRRVGAWADDWEAGGLGTGRDIRGTEVRRDIRKAGSEAWNKGVEGRGTWRDIRGVKVCWDIRGS